MSFLGLIGLETVVQQGRECDATTGGPFGKLVRFADAEVVGSNNTEAAARLVWITKEKDRTPIPVTVGMNVCVGDLIEVWHHGQVVVQADEKRNQFTLEGGSLTWIKGARELDLMRGFAAWHFAAHASKVVQSTFELSAGSTLLSLARSTVRVGLAEPGGGAEPCPRRDVYVEVLERDYRETAGPAHSVRVTPWPGAPERVVEGGAALRIGGDGSLTPASRVSLPQAEGFGALAERSSLELVARWAWIPPPPPPPPVEVTTVQSSLRLDQGLRKFREARHASALENGAWADSGSVDARSRAQEAAVEIRAFLDAEPGHARRGEAHFALGTVWSFLGESDRAAAEYLLLVETEPASAYAAAAYARLGDGWFAKGNMVEAVRAYEGASGDARLGPYVRRQIARCQEGTAAGSLGR